jgi:hypothetical protein
MREKGSVAYQKTPFLKSKSDVIQAKRVVAIA